MAARLVFISGSKAGTAYDLEQEDVSIGRKSDRTITFSSEDVLVSGAHASLLYRDGQYILRDDGSRNGTFVNAEKIRERTLQDGDLVQFGAGGPGARFLLQPAVEAPPTLDPSDMAAAVEMLRRTQPDQVAGSLATASRALTTTREMVVMAVRRGKRNRRWLIAVAVVTVVAIAAVVVQQQLAKANLERTLAELSVSLLAERASRSALEQNLAQVQTQADSLRSLITSEQLSVAADLGIDPDAIREYSRGVALIVFTYGYVEENGSRLLRYVVDSQGGVEIAPGAMGQPVPSITFGGNGPPVKHQGTATGFLIDTAGFLLTNKHVAVPWEKDEQLEVMRSNGLRVTGQFIDIRAFFPPGGDAHPLVIERISPEADVALVRLLGPRVDAPVLPLAQLGDAVKPGDGLVLIGYPTGVHNLLFRVNREARGEIFEQAGGDARRLAEELARRRLIQPLVLNGTISDTTATEVIHSVSTTVGGSGGPLIDLRERVVGVHYASVRSPVPGDAFQTQRGVPVRFAWSILPLRVRRELQDTTGSN
ncbi:MAG: trypsin-like peptidase domain-containing protein [Gemmatimonadota bacterium]|nr:MAG: trypsin-like peptidase domain-containing protein [Gemmatimonadota bacterium]